MKQIILLTVLLAFACTIAYSQTPPRSASAGQPTASASPTPPRVPERTPVGFDLSTYGVSFQTEPRLIVVMAALEAAGFDPVPAGAEPSAFRAQVRKDLATT